MKKITKRTYFIVFVFVIVSSLLMVNAFANVPKERTSCAEHYFSELNGDDVPLNAFGSCGYVAPSMLLAYYDIYWNDRFVSDKYEQNIFYDSVTHEFDSANFMTENGILNAWYEQHCNEGGTLTWDEYINQYYTGFVNTDHNYDFLHLDLIKIGIDKGYHNSVGPTQDYGITIYQTAEVLDAYFDNIFGECKYYDPLNLNINQTTPIKIRTLTSNNMGTTQDEVVSKMYELLGMNIPVIFRGTNQSDEGHVMIAYSTIIENDVPVNSNVHMCWSNSSRVLFSETGFNSNVAILWLEIDESQIPHVHCDNYVEGENRYCSCQVYGTLHPEHVHETTGACQSYDSTSHTYLCTWDEEQVTEPHKFTYQSISNAYHTSECECGYTNVAQHNMERTSPRYSVCSDCRYTRDHHQGGNEMIPWKEEKDSETE